MMKNLAHTNLHINPSPQVALAVDQASRLNNRALTLSGQGDFQGAERLHLLALDLKLRNLGEKHVTTALSRNALGELYIKMTRLDDAEEQLRKAVDVRDKAGPAFDAAASRENLAQVYEMQGNLPKAKEVRRSTGKLACGNYHCPGQVYNLREVKQCGRCTSIYYCTPACQTVDWKRHKKYCPKSQA